MPVLGELDMYVSKIKINNFKIIQNPSIGYLPDLSICEQPDKISLGILKEHNLLNIELKGLFSETEMEITHNGQNETPFEISIKQFPDLFPYLATVAILSNNGTPGDIPVLVIA